MNSLDEIFAAQEKLFSSGYDKAKAYSQVVLGLGYASIFAAWSFTKPFLSRGEVFWSAFLASLSIVAFVVFEVLTTFVASRSLLGMAKALEDKSKFLHVMAKNEKKERKLRLLYAKAWMIIWPFSFVTGVAAAAILIGAFIGHLWSGL